MTAGTVLLVEDDRRLAQLTAEYLTKHHYVVTVQADGTLGLEEARRQHFDIVLLDIMLPGINGISVCQQLRQFSDVPIIMLTARGEEADRVLGLELGADDYLVKPFSPRELVARMTALLRRIRGKAGPTAKTLSLGGLVVEPQSHRATLNGEPLSLTSYEFALLRALAENSGRVLSRERLMELAMGNPDEVFDRSVDVHISRLRAKLETDPRHPRFIKTIRGVGYMMADQH